MALSESAKARLQRTINGFKGTIFWPEGGEPDLKYLNPKRFVAQACTPGEGLAEKALSADHPALIDSQNVSENLAEAEQFVAGLLGLM